MERGERMTKLRDCRAGQDAPQRSDGSNQASQPSRAGRDGLVADCLVYYQPHDRLRHAAMLRARSSPCGRCMPARSQPLCAIEEREIGLPT